MSGYSILIIGSGGREHALAWALVQSPLAGQIYIAPGNAGTESLGMNIPLQVEDIPALVNFAAEKHIDLTVVGPEAPLADGIVDAFQAKGLHVFGPNQAAARLEFSKAFAKSFMQAHNIPTGDYAVFDEYDAADQYLSGIQHPVVVKADGLAAGKGVIICQNRDEAKAAVKHILVDQAFGTAGHQVIIEEQLFGPEISVLAFCDGKTVVTMPPARDHKRIFDGDAGPNTGGMGAYAPAPDIETELMDEIRRTFLQPTLDGMAAQGTPYIGILYAGLMLTKDGPRLLEFNCRFGDPETQVILPLLETDLLEIFLACIEGRLSEMDIQWKPGACATIVIASPGYPNAYPKGLTISGLDQMPEGAVTFHAGIIRKNGHLVTSGGRVLAVSAVSTNLTEALRHAYAAVKHISFEGMHYRRDIGKIQTE